MARQADPRKESFKEKIGFHGLPTPTVGRGIVFEWDSTRSLRFMAGQDWEIEEREPTVLVEFTTREWVLHREDSKVRLEVSIFEDETTAREHLVSIAAATMTVEIPYERFEGPLGDIAIKNFNPNYEDLIWCRANVTVKVRDYIGGNGPQLAQELDRLLGQHEVANLQEFLPIVDHLEVSATRITVGNLVTLVIEARPAGDAARSGQDLIIEVEEADSLLEYVETEANAWRWRAMEAGQATLHVLVVHPETLVSVHRTVEIQIAAAE
jgi:hypothetical protein